MESGHGQRRMERFTLELPSEVRLDGGGDGAEALKIETVNVCAGGAFYKTDQILPEGTEVNVDLILPLDHLKDMEGKRTLIQVTGVVIRTEAGGMAIRFGESYQMRPL